MPRHQEVKWVPYTPRQMFDLVQDVESYPEFLPWCFDAHIHTKREGFLSADLTVGASIFQESFTSDVTLEAPTRITVAYVGGALSHLENIWEFEEGKDGGCLVSFSVDFALKSSALNALMEAFFDKVFSRMVGAFEERALALYG